jgi:hemolysin activation/secretion protein
MAAMLVGSMATIEAAHGQAVLASSRAPAPPRTFDLLELRVEGNTILSETEIDNAIYPFLGPDKTAADVEKARAALEEAYSKRGYATVSATIPPQNPVDGVVIIKVVERPIGRLRVVGAQYVAPRVIRGEAPSLAAGTVPNLNAVQQDLVTLNQQPDLTVTPSLKPGLAPDTVDADLKVDDKLPLHGSLELNNRNSQDTAPLRLNGNVSYGNLWQRGDTIAMGFQVAPQNTANASVYSGSYTFRIPDSRVSILASFIHSDSDVVTLGSTNALGRGNTLQIRALVPLGTLDDFTHSLSAGFDYKDVYDATEIAGVTSETPIQYWPFRVQYSAGWVETRSTTDLNGTLVWAFRGVGSNSLAFDAQRYQATGGFFYVTFDGDRTQELPAGFQAYVHAMAQISPQPLVSPEQLGLGGTESVRGYYESEALGDYGAYGQVELRTPSLAHLVGGPLTSVRLHLFADAGTVAIRDPLPEQASSATLVSVGAGMRVRLYDHFSGSLENATALTNGPATRAGNDRVLFRLTGDF